MSSASRPARIRAAAPTPMTNSIEVDPSIYAVEPDAPFGLLDPGAVIQEGDIKRFVGKRQLWSCTDPAEWGQTVPGSGVAYARVVSPEFYSNCTGDELINQQNMLVWSSEGQKWEEPGNVMQGRIVRECHAEWLERHNTLLYFCQLQAGAPLSQLLPIPSRHRDLYPRELLRNGDKLIFSGQEAWQPVQATAFGQPVGFPSPENGNARYCRPVSANHASWYIDPEKGSEDNLGGFADPWPTKEYAMQRIEKAGLLSQSPPYGTIFTLQGVPCMVYDIPEPASAQDQLEPEFADQNAQALSNAVSTANQFTLGALGTKPRIRTPQAQLPEINNFKPLSTRRVAEALLPAGYSIISRCPVQPRDLIYQPVVGDPDTWMWQPVGQQQIGIQPPSGDLQARKDNPAPTGIELLDQLQQQYHDLGQTLAQLDNLLR